MSFTERAVAILRELEGSPENERNESNEERPTLWDRLLARATAVDPELARRLAGFRDRGCVVAVYFGPPDGLAECEWPDAAAWRADYDGQLGLYEGALRRLLADLLPRA